MAKKEREYLRLSDEELNDLIEEAEEWGILQKRAEAKREPLKDVIRAELKARRKEEGLGDYDDYGYATPSGIDAAINTFDKDQPDIAVMKALLAPSVYKRCAPTKDITQLLISRK